jgi:hypothetical protein
MLGFGLRMKYGYIIGNWRLASNGFSSCKKLIRQIENYFSAKGIKGYGTWYLI